MTFVDVTVEEPWALVLAALGEIIRPSLDPSKPSMMERIDQLIGSGPVGPNFHLTPTPAGSKLTIPTEAHSAIVSVTAQDCHVSFDGTDATAANGLYVAAGTIMKLTGRESMQGFRALEVAAGAVIDAVFFT